MAVVQYSDVGITSNPDPRPANGSATLVTTANWSDPNRGNVTMSVSGRKVVVYDRSPSPYAVNG